MEKTKETDLWIATAILIITAVVMITVILHLVHISFFIGPFRLSHWFTWIGTIYIAIAVPIVALSKKRFPQKYKTLLRVHVFGNLLAFTLTSFHFASQISRPAESYPDLGTGIVLYMAMILLVSTGIIQRFQLKPNIKPQTYRFLHTGSALVFYLTIVIHILHGLGML